VKSIGYGAFSGCGNLEKVVIAQSVAEMTNNIFTGCEKLKSAGPLGSGADIEYGWTEEIPNRAFYGCGLTSVKLPASITKMGSDVFDGNPALTSAGPTGSGASIEYGWTNIPDRAFASMDSLQTVTFPERWTQIGERAFYGCANLTEIEISDRVTRIATEAFADCTGLERVRIPKGVYLWGWRIFAGCTKLKTAGPYGSGSNMEFGWTETIPFRAFDGCRSLTSVILPKSLTKIEGDAFLGCSSLAEIDLPESLTKIGSGAFENCSLLKSISIPKGVTDIGFSAFKGCTSLASVTLPEGISKIEAGTFEGCKKLAEINLPERITVIGNGAFEKCASLTGVTVPGKVSKIGSDAFAGCGALSEIRFQGSAPEFGADAFSGVTAAAYYSDRNTTWTDDKRQNYGGTLSWQAFGTTGQNPCGADARWEFFEDGVLVISGAGKIDDYGTEPENAAPWAAHRDAIRKIVIEPGITQIGTRAFSGCGALWELEIPESLEEIGADAFADCGRLSEVYYGGSATQWSRVRIDAGNAALEQAARYDEIKEVFYTVTFDLAGGERTGGGELSQIVEEGKSATAPEAVRDGYKFAGWEGDWTNVTSDRVVTAQWAKKETYTVTFDLAGGRLPSGSPGRITYVREGESLPVSSVPKASEVAREGYEFAGWDGDWTNVTEVRTITAIWRKIPEKEPDVYTVQFDLAGGKRTGGGALNQTIEEGKSATVPEVTRAGYEFAGWDGDYTNVASDRTITAKWRKIEEEKPTPTPTPPTCTIKATAGTGGKVSGAGSKKQGEKVTLKAVANSGYYFAGWKEGKKTVSTSATYSFKVSKNRALTATFAKLAAPKLTAKAASYDSVKLTFPKVSGAVQYEIYYGTSAKSMKKAATVKAGSGKTVSYTHKGRATGKAHYYKVRAKSAAGTYSAFSSVKSAKPALASPGSVKAAAAGKKSAKISWKKVSGASGYEVYRATSKGGKYGKVTDIRKGAAVSYTNTKLTAKKTYYYKVRAYRTVSGKKVYGAYSGVKSVTVKK